MGHLRERIGGFCLDLLVPRQQLRNEESGALPPVSEAKLSAIRLWVKQNLNFVVDVPIRHLWATLENSSFVLRLQLYRYGWSN